MIAKDHFAKSRSGFGQLTRGNPENFYCVQGDVVEGRYGKEWFLWDG